MSPPVRYALFPLAAAIFAAIALVLTEIALGYYGVDSLLVIILGNLAGGGVMLLISANNLSGMSLIWQRRNLAAVVVGGLLIYTVAYLMAFKSIALIGAGKVALLGQLETVFVVIFAIIFLGETLTRRRLMAALLAFTGTALINVNLQSLEFTLGWGEVLAILSPVCIAAGIITLKRVLDLADARQVTGLAMLLGAIFLTPFVPVMVSLFVVSGVALAVIGVMGTSRGLSWLTYNIGLKRIGASRGAIIFISFAFFTVILQAGVAQFAPQLGVQLPPNLIAALVGGALIAAGIVVLQTDRTSTQDRSLEEDQIVI
jgi:drug/metabolite transporter (DMT)-like permease